MRVYSGYACTFALGVRAFVGSADTVNGKGRLTHLNHCRWKERAKVWLRKGRVRWGGRGKGGAGAKFDGTKFKGYFGGGGGGCQGRWPPEPERNPPELEVCVRARSAGGRREYRVCKSSPPLPGGMVHTACVAVCVHVCVCGGGGATVASHHDLNERARLPTHHTKNRADPGDGVPAL